MWSGVWVGVWAAIVSRFREQVSRLHEQVSRAGVVSRYCEQVSRAGIVSSYREGSHVAQASAHVVTVVPPWWTGHNVVKTSNQTGRSRDAVNDTSKGIAKALYVMIKTVTRSQRCPCRALAWG